MYHKIVFFVIFSTYYSKFLKDSSYVIKICIDVHAFAKYIAVW
jgi:hypothetical protein